MIRTLIFGAIAAIVGKKLYDDGKLTEFKNDLVGRVDQLQSAMADKKASSPTAPSVDLPKSTSTTPSSTS